MEVVPLKNKVMVLAIRNFPKDLHYKAKIQAAIEAISLKDLFIKSLTEYLEKSEK
jgi:hypothetical protein